MTNDLNRELHGNDPLLDIRGTRIAHLIETDGPGGAERLLADLAVSLAAGGCPGVVFLPQGRERWLTREAESAGLHVEHYRLDHPFSPRCARDLAAAFRRHDIGLAHSHEFTMSVYGACAARTAGIPHVITMHGGRYYAGRLRRRLAMRFAVEASGAIVAVSQELAAHLSHDLRVGRDRIQVISNGVAARRAAMKSTLRDELGLAPDDRILLAVGNLYPVKGHRYLIEALSLLDPALRAHVAIAGRGEMATDLDTYARSLGVAGRVHLLGLRHDVTNLHSAADIFVHPSLAEGLPLALLEAMYAGCPIVASAVGEVPYVLDSGTAGLLVPPANPRLLAQALDRLLMDVHASRSLGTRAAARAQDVFGLDGMVRQYVSVYASLLTPQAGTSHAGSGAAPRDRWT